LRIEEEILNRQGAEDAKEEKKEFEEEDFLTADDTDGHGFEEEDFLTTKEEKIRESWVFKNRIHSLLGALGVLAVQILRKILKRQGREGMVFC
jgi:hypothetical protein